jgi:hypothetical protein
MAVQAGQEVINQEQVGARLEQSTCQRHPQPLAAGQTGAAVTRGGEVTFRGAGGHIGV